MEYVHVCVFKPTVDFIAVTFLICLQLVSITVKSGNVACDDNGAAAWVFDLQCRFTACTWGACDISPGGSIYVENKPGLQWIWIPALCSIEPYIPAVIWFRILHI